MAVKDPLDLYRRKRNFGHTPEPKGARIGRAGPEFPRFVIQKHHARRLHYDFRLEVGGVLKSWAVPKGPSMDPGTRRLAVPTEDHPLDYADFEGVIPAPEYGAGPVLVWDRGFYLNITRKTNELIPTARAVEHGHIVFWLEGRKLRGGFSLTRFGAEKDKRWFLVKRDDTASDSRQSPVDTEPRSVLTGRTIEEIRARGGPFL